MKKENIRNFCVAPMMGYTTPHARYFFRLLTKKAFLFTEMVAAKTLIHSKNKEIFVKNAFRENPIALQVGGSDENDLAKCAQLAEYYGFQEINLNVGCPSKAVQKGRFGACLMKEKELVKNCLVALKKNTSIEVTMKCRLGVDEFDSYDFFKNFISEISESEINIIYVHARTAILNGLSPKNNRNIPPLKYDYVSRIKDDFPHINFIVNGGIKSIEQAKNLSKKFDGVMLGRLVQSNPFILNNVDELFYNDYKNDINYTKILKNYFNYIKLNLNNDSIYRLCSPLLNIFFGVPNCKKSKAKINLHMQNKNISQLEVLYNSLSYQLKI